MEMNLLDAFLNYLRNATAKQLWHDSVRLGLAVGLAWCFVPAAKHLLKAVKDADDRTDAQYELLDVDELMRRSEAARNGAIHGQNIGSTVAESVDIIRKIWRNQHSTERLKRLRDKEGKTMGSSDITDGINAGFSYALRTYRARMDAAHGLSAMNAAVNDLASEFRVETISTQDWAQVRWLVLVGALWTIAWALLINLVNLHIKGFSVWKEVTKHPVRLVLFSVIWPATFTLRLYPREDLVQHAMEMAWLMASALTVFMGAAGAGVKAQNFIGGKKSNGKTPSGRFLITDLREEADVIDGDGKTTTLRLVLGKGGDRKFLEALLSGKTSTLGGNSESALVTQGFTLFRHKDSNNQVTFNGVAGFRFLRNETASGVVTYQTRLVLGAQLYALLKDWQSYTPALRLERDMKGNTYFVFTSQILRRAGPGRKFWLGIEGNDTKQFGKPPSGYFGAVAAFDPRPSTRVEVGGFRALTASGWGASSLRFRLIHKFSF